MKVPKSAPGAPKKNSELSRVWALARKWRAERDHAIEWLEPGQKKDAAELSRVWALARKWRAERDAAYAQLGTTAKP